MGKYACHLQLPPMMKLHNILHVQLLNPTSTDPYPSQRSEQPPPVEVDGEEEWEVSDILQSRTF